MKKILRISIFLIITNLFFSCDCMKTASGIVYDAQTKLPLVNVIYNGSSNLTFEIKTNEKGEFKIMKIDGRRCKIIRTFFSKENYKTKKVKIKNRTKDNSIYLEPKK